MSTDDQRASGQPSDSDYKVGYRKPPKHTQFKKGQKRAIKSKIRSRPDVHAELRKELKRQVTATVNGEEERITAQKALFLRLRQRAIQGVPWAQKLVARITKELPEGNFIPSHIETQLEVFKVRLGLEWKLQQIGRTSDAKNDE